MNIMWNINVQFCPLLATNTRGHLRKTVSVSVLMKYSSYDSDVRNEVFSTAKIITLIVCFSLGNIYIYIYIVN